MRSRTTHLSGLQLCKPDFFCYRHTLADQLGGMEYAQFFGVSNKNYTFYVYL